MGSTFGRLLSENGLGVVTTLEGRSPRTQRLCREAGLSVLDSVSEVLERSDVLMSFVTPGAAFPVAQNVATLLKSSSRRLTYVDANSISPMTAVKIYEVLPRDHVDFVDASIRGLASQLRQTGILFLSGSRAEELWTEFRPIMRAKVIGDAPGQASGLKMVLAGLPKGLIGLFLEVMVFARRMQLLDEAMEICNEFYPGVMEVVERMLPTYLQHAARRSEELMELEETMLVNGMTPRLIRAVRELTLSLTQRNWLRNTEPPRLPVGKIVEEIYQDNFLPAPEPPVTPAENVLGETAQPSTRSRK